MADNNNGSPPDWIKGWLPIGAMLVAVATTFALTQNTTKTNASAIASLRVDIREIIKDINTMQIKGVTRDGELSRAREKFIEFDRKLEAIQRRQ